MKSPGHLRVQELRLAPGEDWTDTSQAWRFVRIHKGSAYWLELLHPQFLDEGEVVVIGPAAKAVIQASQLNEVLLFGFKFVPDSLCGFFTVEERHCLDLPEGGRQARFLSSTHPAAKQFAAFCVAPDPREILVRRAELLGLAVCFLCETAVCPRLPTRLGSTNEKRFQEIICQMPDQEIMHHSPNELASMCGCSPRHFSRLFRARFGISPGARQTELRLMNARHLLAGTGANIAQVAMDSGYRNSSRFCALFKRKFGLTPSEYRERQATNAT